MTSDSEELDTALRENLRLRSELAANVEKDSSKSQRLFRLNGWQRIGILLSVAWAMGALVLVYVGWRDLEAGHSNAYFECIFAPGNNDERSCQSKKDAWDNEPKQYVQTHLPGSLAPIPIAWVVAYVLVWIARWVRRGFQPAS